MRSLSDAIKKVQASNYGETKDVVVITIPAQVSPPIPETNLHLANGSGVVSEGIEYQNKLRSISQIKFSLSHAADGATAVLENVSRDLGYILSDTTRVLDGSQAVIKRLFRIEDNSFEPETLFVGQITGVKIDQETINISLVSDMSKRATSVAGRTVTQRCIWVFNVNGDGRGPNCGWKITQPGNPASCDHDLDSANGCRSHGNVHRFGGVPAFTTTQVANNGYSGSSDGWGTGSGGGWCVHPDTYVLCDYEGTYFWNRAYHIKSGDYIVSKDQFGRYQKTKVVEANKGTTTRIYTITSKRGYSVTCSPSHPLMTGRYDSVGTAVKSLRLNDSILSYDYKSNGLVEDSVAVIEASKASSNVIMFQLEEPYHLYIAGNDKTGGIWSHNLKPIYTDVPYESINVS